jgi:GT2 family glycosyltransferase
MKFDARHPDAKPMRDQFHFNGSTYMPVTIDAPCFVCTHKTTWRDLNVNQPICSDECSQTVWHQIKQNRIKELTQNHFTHNRDAVLKELTYANAVEDASKDILIVVRNQLPYLKMCLDSIIEHTKNYKIYIWDNGSNQEMQDYLEEMKVKLAGNLEWCRSEQNMGFNEPNNVLATFGEGKYIILLNSDTKVHKGWSEAMLGYLQNNPNTKTVGYLGGLLDADAMGGRAAFGSKIDYVCGWCMCFERETYYGYGLFNKQLRFAYCEDADFSLRLLEAGHDIYALHLLLVHHFENKTINEVKDEGEVNVRQTFAMNHEYMRLRWADYLNSRRVDVRDDTLQSRSG